MADEARIERGRGLKRLRDDDKDFAYILDEIKERLEHYSSNVLAFRRGSRASDLGIDYFLYRYQGLQELLGWIERVYGLKRN